MKIKTKRFVTTDYTGCSYITAGKLYSVLLKAKSYSKIRDNDGDSIYVNTTRPSGHLGCSGSFKFATL